VEGVADLAVVGAAFGERLRGAGLGVSAERIGRFVRGVEVVRPITVGELRAIGRVTLVSGPDERETFDAVFGQVFGGLDDVADHRGDPGAPAVRRTDGAPPWVRRSDPAGQSAGSGSEPQLGAASDGDQDDEDDDSEGRREAVLAAASRQERLATTDFAELTEAEVRELYETMRSIRVALPRRRGRRHRRHRHGDRLDLRATVRRSRRTGGEPFQHVTRHRRPRPRRLVVLCDISGSMSAYSRAFVQFLHAAVNASGSVEVFTFATRLTRVTRALAVRRPDDALARAAAAASDWRGGTRVGDCLKTFLDDHGRRGLARRAVVIIVSDGWDRSEPGVLGEQMARLHRLAHRIVWINPRRAAPGYEPLAAGMAAALPYCDELVSGHTLAALREALVVL
jgi:uncharacterized protein with von Willebrand factor type A (vWA) domain